MIPRGKLDIGWLDLFAGLLRCAVPGRAEARQARLERFWVAAALDGAAATDCLLAESWFYPVESADWSLPRSPRPGKTSSSETPSRYTGTPITNTASIPADGSVGSEQAARSMTTAGSNTTRSASAPSWSRPLLTMSGTRPSRTRSGAVEQTR